MMMDFGDIVGEDYVNTCIFEKYDKDGSKQLELNELKIMLKKDYGLNPDQIGVQALLLDTDKDGKVSFEELNKWLKEGEKLNEVKDTSRFGAMKMAAEKFQKFDTNKSWDLDRHEFEKFYKENNYKADNMEAVMNELFSINFRKFMDWMVKVDSTWFGGKEEDDLFLFNMNDLVNDAVFKEFDGKENSKMSSAEIEKLLKDNYGLNDEQINIQSLLLDTDGDGMVSKEEFTTWLNSGATLDQVSENSRFNKMKKAGELFKKADTDKSGSLEKSEFVAFYKSNELFPNLNIREVGPVLKELDPDNNGKVSFQAFLAWMNSKDEDWFANI